MVARVLSTSLTHPLRCFQYDPAVLCFVKAKIPSLLYLSFCLCEKQALLGHVECFIHKHAKVDLLGSRVDLPIKSQG